MEKKEFDGKLTEQELRNLRKYGFEEKEIRLIEEYVYKYREHLTGFVDFIGDKEAPSRMFLYNIKHYGYLLEDDPEKVISKKDVLLRRLIVDKLVKKIGPNFLLNKQVFENRNYLRKEPTSYRKTTNNNENLDSKTKMLLPEEPVFNEEMDNIAEDPGIILPEEPVIWTPNHHFKDDVLASYLATYRQAYILFGSMPQFYNSIDGVLANLVGSLMTNRKVKSSKKASINKAVRAQKLGADILCFPEGVHDKLPHELLLDFWPGIYQIANETGSPVVPIIHYIYDATLQMNPEINLIHTVVDEPIDITKFSEKQGLEYVRDVIATWYYLMMEKYGKTTRENIIKFYKNKALERNTSLTEKEFEKRPLTTHEAFELYLMDYLDTIDWYDSEIELSYDYRPKDIARPEDVFEPIANLQPSLYNPSSYQKMDYILPAKQLVRTRKQEDYQRRF